MAEPARGVYTDPSTDGSSLALPLPATDVRMWLDERAARAWAESGRDLLRLAGLYASDTVAGLAGVYTALETWSLVSAGGSRPVPNEIPLLAMVFCILPLALRVVGAYRGGRARTQFLRIAGGIAIAAFLGWIQARLFGRIPPLPDKAAYVYSAVLICGYVWAARVGIDLLLAVAYRRSILQRRVVVVGSADDVQALQDRAATHGSDLRIVGRIATDDGAPSQSPRAFAGRVPLVGRVGQLREALSTARAHVVVVVAPLPLTALQSLVSECFLLGAAIEVQPHALSGIPTAQVEIRRSSAGAFLHLHSLRLDLPQMAIKRTMDVLLAAGVLVAIAPLMLLITIAIKLDSRGPVLFRQARMGVGGRRFQILKFRTMVVGADQQKASLLHLNQYADPRLFKIRHDPRITRLGRFLRKSSLDELPQLWNVLRGDMSLVGPRPCVPEEFEHYAPHHMERLFVVPGVTGPWQVSGRNSVLDFEEVVRLDSEYIRSWSLLRDVVILLKTIPALYGKGAY
jgi:exopolysaccharide biosynthesis polyprenyl glycosylphosphotransferase